MAKSNLRRFLRKVRAGAQLHEPKTCSMCGTVHKKMPVDGYKHHNRYWFECPNCNSTLAARPRDADKKFKVSKSMQIKRKLKKMDAFSIDTKKIDKKRDEEAKDTQSYIDSYSHKFKFKPKMAKGERHGASHQNPAEKPDKKLKTEHPEKWHHLMAAHHKHHGRKAMAEHHMYLAQRKGVSKMNKSAFEQLGDWIEKARGPKAPSWKISSHGEYKKPKDAFQSFHSSEKSARSSATKKHSKGMKVHGITKFQQGGADQFVVHYSHGKAK